MTPIRKPRWSSALIVATAVGVGCAPAANRADEPDDIEEIRAPLHTPGNGSGGIETECLNAAGATAVGGRVHNRFLWCQKMRTPLEVLIDGVPVPQGFVNADAIAYGRDDGNRSVEVFYRVTSVDFLGPAITPATIFIPSIECQDNPLPGGPFTPSACAVQGLRPARTLAVWRVNPDPVSWVVTSDETLSLNPDRVSRHDFRFAFQFETNGQFSTIARDVQHRIRCDSAAYFRFRPKACILDDVLPHLRYSVNDPRQAGVALHIANAFAAPSGTFPLRDPPGGTKQIPGRYTGNPNDPGLHRIVYQSPVWQANSTEKDRACNLRAPYQNTGLSPELYDRQTQDCDEFPFASTAEGAASPLWDFSVLGVNRSQNRCAGNALKRFYTEDRILYQEDTFWVEITQDPSAGGPDICFLSPEDEPSDDADFGGIGGGNAPIPDTPPIVSAGPDVAGDEGRRVRLSGSATDADTVPTVSWSYRAVAGVDAGTTCTFENGGSSSPVFTCTDDGTFEVTITANDGFHDAVSDTALVQLRNVAPALSLASPQAWQAFRAGRVVALQAPFVDPGANDTHTCVVGWDDGSVETFAAAAGACNRSHTFTRAGMFTINVTVTDDDGGSDAKTVMIVVYDPAGGFTNADGSIPSPPGALTANPGFAGEEWFHLAARYYNLADVPTGNAQTWLPGTNFRLDSGSAGLEWLVVTPDGKVAARGSGTLQGQPGRYGFVFYGYDGCAGQTTGCQPGADRFRIVVWSLSVSPNPGAGTVYDNRSQAGYDIDVAEPQGLRSGLVLIQPPT